MTEHNSSTGRFVALAADALRSGDFNTLQTLLKGDRHAATAE